MIAETPDRQHILDLLPAYLNGTLEDALVGQVHAHLAACQGCQDELLAWQMVQGTTQLAAASLAIPAAPLLEGVWARLDAPAPALSIKHRPARRWLFHS